MELESKICLICHDSEEKLISAHPGFQHLYHFECLYAYRKMSNSNTCPLCSLPIGNNLFQDSLIDDIQYAYVTGNSGKLIGFIEDGQVSSFSCLLNIIHRHSVELLTGILGHDGIRLQLKTDCLESLLDFAFTIRKPDMASAILTWIMRKRAVPRTWLTKKLKAGKKELVMFILEHTHKDRFYHELYWACLQDELDIVMFWFEFLPTLTDDTLLKCLRSSIEGSKIDTFRFLMSKIECEIPEKETKQMVELALKKQHWDTVKVLDKNGQYIPQERYNCILAQAIGDQHWDMVKWMIRKGAIIDKTELSRSILPAVIANKLVAVQTLLDFGASANYNHSKALIKASKFGRKAILKLLIKAGANIHTDDGAVLKTACSYKQEDMLPLIFSYLRGDEPYIEAADMIDSSGRISWTMSLLRAEIDPEYKKNCRFLSIRYALNLKQDGR